MPPHVATPGASRSSLRTPCREVTYAPRVPAAFRPLPRPGVTVKRNGERQLGAESALRGAPGSRAGDRRLHASSVALAGALLLCAGSRRSPASPSTGWCWWSTARTRSTTASSPCSATPTSGCSRTPAWSRRSGGAQVAIVEFDTRSEIVVDWTDPQSAALAYRRKAPDGLRGQTGIGSALTTALALLAGKSGRLVIDVSGDGRENVDHALLARGARGGERAGDRDQRPRDHQPRGARDRPLLQRPAWSMASCCGSSERDDFLDALKRKLFYEIAGDPPAARRSRGSSAERARSMPKPWRHGERGIFAPDLATDALLVARTRRPSRRIGSRCPSGSTSR